MKKLCQIFLLLLCFQTYSVQARVVCVGNLFEKNCQGVNHQGQKVHLIITGMPPNEYISGRIGENALSLKFSKVQNTIRLQGFFGQLQINVQAYVVQNTEFATGHIGMQNFNIRTYKKGNLYHIVGFIGTEQINKYTTALSEMVYQTFQMPFIPIASYYFLKTMN